MRSYKNLRTYSVKVMANVPKKFKYPMVTKYWDTLFSTLQNICMLSHERRDDKKVPLIDTILCEYDIITDIVQFLVEEKGISTKQAEHLYVLIDEIGRQLGGLKKFLQKKGLPELDS